MDIGKVIQRISSSVWVLAAAGACGLILWLPVLLLVFAVFACGGADPFVPIILAAVVGGVGAYFLSRTLGYPTEVPGSVSAAGFAAGFLLPPGLFVWFTWHGIWTGVALVSVLLLVLLLLCMAVVVYVGAYCGAIAARGGRQRPAKEPSCPACGYSLYYASGQRCPECGREFGLHEVDLRLAEWEGGCLRPRQGQE